MCLEWFTESNQRLCIAFAEKDSLEREVDRNVCFSLFFLAQKITLSGGDFFGGRRRFFFFDLHIHA